MSLLLVSASFCIPRVDDAAKHIRTRSGACTEGNQDMSEERKHIDRRITRSRDAIVSAFERLLVTNDIDKITVSAIAREANIDRKTFYVHFGTIDGLLDAIAERYVDQVINEVNDSLGWDESKGPIDAEKASEQLFVAINHLICDNLQLNRRFMANVPADTLLTRVRRPFERRLLKEGVFSRDVKRELIEYYLSFVLGGILSVYRAWMLSDGSTPIELVSDVANDIMLNGIRGMKSLEMGGAAPEPTCER